MAELHVSRQSISKLFKDMQNRKFIIPDFQRPYQWDIEKCETLWNDIVNFAEVDAKEESDYFLGTIVSDLMKPNKDLEIIDGQQRITTLFLLLRAFYKKLENMPEDDDVIGLKNQISPCIWDINPISQKVSDKTKFHIESLVATEENNAIFHKILETGDCDETAKDHYSKNYHFFKGKSDDYAKNNPMQWKKLCITILHQCIILPIECNAPETALTIFSTLNDRGLPLSDADIFKAKIYGHTAITNRPVFTEDWKALSEVCEEANIAIDDVFRYYTHQLRAKKDDKSREIGLRKFYTEKGNEKLQDKELVSELVELAKFWRYINNNKKPDDSNYSISLETKKYLHCLQCYTNEFWKYPVSVFFLNNKNSETFDIDFCKVLKKLVAFLFAKYIEIPSVNAIKDNIYIACISLQGKKEISFLLDFNEESLRKKMTEDSIPKLARGLLLLDAYLHPNQNELIRDGFDIEHIFPKKWQNTNYNGWDKKSAELYLEHFGNKIVFERKLNIQAGNGYFGKKKGEYAKSKIACVQELAQYPENDWVKKDIEIRGKELIERIIGFFKSQLS